jgi:DNA-binding NarL/FixJ family response regulator
MTSESQPDIRVFVIEDTLAIQQAMRLLVDGLPGFCCVGTVGTAEAALESELSAPPDVILVDIGLPGMSGIDALPLLHRRWPRAELLMLTVHDNETQVFAALRAGASGYMLKTTPPSTLMDGIREAYEGGAPMSASVARQVVQTFQRPASATELLSVRERTVLDALVEGKTYRQIGDSLFISVNTVAFHVKQIYQKLHVHSRAEALALLNHRTR